MQEPQQPALPAQRAVKPFLLGCWGLATGREVPSCVRSPNSLTALPPAPPGCPAAARPERGAATHREAPAEEGLQEGRLACAPGSQHLAEEDVSLGLAFFQVNPLLPGHWQERGWVSKRRDLSCDRRGGHGRTREGLCLGVLLREDGVAQVAQALQAVPHIQVSHEPGETERTGKPTRSARAKRSD